MQHEESNIDQYREPSQIMEVNVVCIHSSSIFIIVDFSSLKAKRKFSSFVHLLFWSILA